MPNSPHFDSPNDGVFIGKYAKGNKSLFQNQMELANEMMNHPGSNFHEKNPLTVRSAISQIFTGERNLSKKMRDILFLVIEPRFDKKKYSYPEFEKLLVEKFRANFEERIANKRSRIGDRDYWNLLDATKKGKEFLITTLEPAELHKSELANRLKNELLEKTGIYQKEGAEIDVEPAKYKFYLPDEEDGRVAREFWEELRKYAIEESDIKPEEIDKRLIEANSDGRIVTYLTPLEIATHPYVFIDYNNTRRITGFCVSYKSENPSVAELSHKVVYSFMKIYKPQFADIETQIEKNFIYEPK